jgi:uncharacterized delta-60 repeat protein
MRPVLPYFYLEQTMRGPRDVRVWVQPLEARSLLSANLVDATDLDPTFGTMGRAVIDFGVNSEGLAHLLGLPGGQSFLLERHNLTGSPSLASNLLRLNADGSPDAAFGTGGFLALPGDQTVNQNRSMALTPDGHILVAGSTRDGSVMTSAGVDDFLLQRLNPDGSADATFGTAGLVRTDIAMREDVAVKVLPQPDGRIVVAGYEQHMFLSRVFQRPHAVLVRYEANGQLDTTFGTGGRVVTELAGFEANRAASAVLQPDGKIVVVGTAIRTEGDGSIVSGDLPQVMLLRYNSDGTPDQTFGGDGVAVTAARGSAREVALGPDGTLIVAGERATRNERTFAVMRFKANGSADRSFGGGGTAVVRLKQLTGQVTESGSAGHLAVQPDGGVVAVGQASNVEAALVRLRPNGRPDADFGDRGRFITPAASNSTANLLLQPDGKIVTTLDGDDVVLTRYMGVPVKPFAALNRGVLRVTGTDADDDIALSLAEDPAVLSISQNGYEQRVPFADVQRIVIDARAGDDSVSAAGLQIPAGIRGGAGADTLTGSEGVDRIDGGTGDDTILARDGAADIVVGGSGTDLAQLDEAIDRRSGVETLLP